MNKRVILLTAALGAAAISAVLIAAVVAVMVRQISQAIDTNLLRAQRHSVSIAAGKGLTINQPGRCLRKASVDEFINECGLPAGTGHWQGELLLRYDFDEGYSGVVYVKHGHLTKYGIFPTKDLKRNMTWWDVASSADLTEPLE